MSYVRLKHALSTLVLETITLPPGRRVLPWLRAFVALSPSGGPVSIEALEQVPAPAGTAAAKGQGQRDPANGQTEARAESLVAGEAISLREALERLQALGLVVTADGTVALPPPFRPHAPYFVERVARLADAVEALDAVDGLWGRDDLQAALLRGVILFNAGLYFECHEYLEEVWRHRSPPDDRDFYQGIIQVAAAFYHFEKGNQFGARRSLEKALPRLERYRPAHLDIDVEALLVALRPWQERFRTPEPGRPIAPPDRPRIVHLPGARHITQGSTTSAPRPSASVEPLLDRLVTTLREKRYIRSSRVEQAFRSVPRHLFLPHVAPEVAYSEEAVVTRRDASGMPISSSSMPAIMAAMLEQLDVRPGHRVLEIGAGTGYNAALLAVLAGPTGRVTTVDLDEDIVQEARAHLADAGLAAHVVCRDGWLGVGEDAPFDRIVVTAGVWDLSPHWFAQLREGGVLVVPLWLRAGLQASVALRREEGRLRSLSLEPCGFMRLRGPHRGPEEYVKVGEWFAAADEPTAEWVDALREVLALPPRTLPAPPVGGVWVNGLLLGEPGAVNLFGQHDWRRSLIGIFDPAAPSLAAVERAQGEEPRVVVYGTDATLERLRGTFDRPGVELRELRIEAVPAGTGSPAGPSDGETPLAVFRRPHFTLVISRTPT